LPQYPDENKDNKEIHGIHRTDGGGNDNGQAVVELETSAMFDVDVFGNMAAFKIGGEVVWHNLYYSGL